MPYPHGRNSILETLKKSYLPLVEILRIRQSEVNSFFVFINSLIDQDLGLHSPDFLEEDSEGDAAIWDDLEDDEDVRDDSQEEAEGEPLAVFRLGEDYQLALYEGGLAYVWNGYAPPDTTGAVWYTIPEGTQTGTTFRLRGKGIPNVNGRGRGDQFVTVHIETPRNLNREQKEALRKFSETLKENNYEERKSFFKKFKR